MPHSVALMANCSIAKRWEVVRHRFNSSRGEDKVENSSISSDVSAEFCVRLLRTSRLQNFSGLKTKLQTSSNQWMSEFLIQGGLEVLFKSLERLTMSGKMAFLEAFMQLECVNCIKAVMNSKQGLDSLVQNKSLVRSLAKGWLCFFFQFFLSWHFFVEKLKTCKKTNCQQFILGCNILWENL